MADANNNANNPNNNHNQNEDGGGAFGLIRQVAFQIIVFLVIRSLLMPAAPGGGGGGGANGTHAVLSRNLFQHGNPMELHFYISEQENFSSFDDPSKLVWHLEGLTYGDWESGPDLDGSRFLNTSIVIPEAVQQNGSLYGHIYLTKHGHSPDPNSPLYDKTSCAYTRKLLTRYLPKDKFEMRKNLFSGEENEELIQSKSKYRDAEIISFWHPNLTINVVDDMNAYSLHSLPPQMLELMTFDVESKNYFPVLYANDFWSFREDMQPINETTPTLSLFLTFSHISSWKWTLMTQMDASMKMQEQYGLQEDASGATKKILLETNPYLLGITMLVSMVHSIFDCLAFKNDIQFWKNRQSMEGLSVRTLFVSIFSQLIILLYLFDNDTSWLILISSSVGLVIEVWKIKKAMKISVVSRPGYFFPRIVFEDRSDYTATTKEYDETAFKYLGYALVPLLLGYAIYSFIYNTHKGWYSYIISMLAGSVYTFGFLMMCPQLFINYKMKSVAHLPWRMMTYKALNTFIDDLFAFVIKMPTMHRIACFRDDVIFFIYLYQRWLYPVDYSRRNEFGVSGDELNNPSLNSNAEDESETNGNKQDGAKESQEDLKTVNGGVEENSPKHETLSSDVGSPLGSTVSKDGNARKGPRKGKTTKAKSD